MPLNKRIFIPIFAGFIIQIFTAWNSFFYHSDEYFQIIEFAAHKYHIAPVTSLPWEFSAEIRPSLQIHFFGLFYKCLTALGVHDRFLIVSLLSTLTGIIVFGISNYLVIDRFKNRTFLPNLLWINNFFWLIPYLRCRFSSEVIGAFFWILGVLLLQKSLAKKTNKTDQVLLFLAGLSFSFSFYCRFQILFALVAVAVWFFLVHSKKPGKAVIICLGFLAGIAFNIFLDKLYYGEWLFTPYRYFYANIIEGKANSFGTSPWWTYLALLLVAAIPLASLALFAFFLKALTLYKNPFALGTLFFIIGHSIVGHKEERFMFPAILIMVYLAAEAYDKFPVMRAKANAIWKNPFYGWAVRLACYGSFIVNIIVIILFSVETYKQPLMFMEKFNDQSLENEQVISFRQHPYNTESGLRYGFLSQNKYDDRIHVIDNREKFIETLQEHPYFKYCILLADARQNKLEYLLQNRHGIVASSFIWVAANWLAKNFDIIIPDLWICQTYSEVTKNSTKKAHAVPQMIAKKTIFANSSPTNK